MSYGSEALHREQLISEMEGPVDRVVEAVCDLLATYGSCPLRGQRALHPLLVSCDRPCLQEACAIWDSHGNRCGMVRVRS